MKRLNSVSWVPSIHRVMEVIVHPCNFELHKAQWNCTPIVMNMAMPRIIWDF